MHLNLLMLTLMAIGTVVAYDNDDYNICTELYKLDPKVSNNNNKLPILSIGVTAKRLLVLTRALTVYNLTYASMLPFDRHRIRLSDARPVSLSSLWPIISQAVTEEVLTAESTHVFTWTNTNTNEDFIYVLTGQHSTSVVVSLDTGLIQYGVIYDGQTLPFIPNPIWLSQDVLSGSLYRIDQYREDGPLTIIKDPFYNLTNLHCESAPLPICSINTTHIQLNNNKTGDPCPKNNVAWPIKLGFLAQHMFYLLAADKKVYIFPEGAYGLYSSPVPFTVVNIEKFFDCSEAPQPSETSPKSDTNQSKRTVLIVAIIVIVLVALALWGLVMLFWKKNSATRAASAAAAARSKSRSTGFNKYRPPSRR